MVLVIWNLHKIMSNILNKFTFHAKKALVDAQDLAFVLKKNRVEPLFLLYILAKEKGSLAAEVLNKNGMKPEIIKKYLTDQEIPTIIQRNIIEREKLPQLSESANKIIEQAAKIAFKYRHKYVGTEHFLTSLIKTEDTELKKFFTNQKIDLINLDQQLTTVLKSTSKFPDLASGKTQLPDNEMEKVLAENQIDQSALGAFTTNLTDKKIQKNIDPVIGRENEISRIIQILSRRTKNNPILLGDAGVGKTAIVEGLAKKIMNSEVPDVLLNKKILNLDLGSVVSGTMYRGEFENRIKQIIAEVKKDPNIILFVDELHTIIGAGAATGSMDAANLFKPELARGNLRMIGATTLEEYKKHVESDPALERRFQPVNIEEASLEETKKILIGIKENYEKYHQVKITNEALQAAIDLSHRYIQDKLLPDKAIDLVDEAAAGLKVSQMKNTSIKKIIVLEKDLIKLQRRKDQAVLDENFDEALNLRKSEDEILKKLKKLKDKEQDEKKEIYGTITQKEIADIVSKMTNIPLQELLVEEKVKLAKLEERLEKRIVGQDEALKIIADSIRRSRVGITDPRRPLASFIFLGPSGVGKTETAKVLAREIFEDENALIRIDMSEFAESFNVSKLIGAPAGYVGYKEGTKLTDAVKRRPYSVVLFDEIEKAHPEVFNLLLPILEDGHLTDAIGKKINFKNTIIIMTSNIGLKEFNQQAEIGFSLDSDSEKKTAEKNYDKLKNKINSELKERFRPEFLNRLDKIVIYKPLDEKSAIKIASLQLDELKERTLRQGYNLKITPSVEKLIVKLGFTPKEGARTIRRTIQEYIESPLAKKILDDNFRPDEEIKIEAKGNKIIFN